MPIAKYPRIGRRIAPRSLAELLNEPLSTAILRDSASSLLLKDLDDSAWAKLGDVVCRRAAGEVVLAVARHLNAIGHLRIATLPDGLQWQHLEIGVRTYNALMSNRGLARPTELTGWSVAELMKTRAFGVVSLVDLLVALEDATDMAAVVEGREPEGAPALCGQTEPVHDGPEVSSDLEEVLRRLPAFLESRFCGIPDRLQWADLDVSVRVHNALVV